MKIIETTVETSLRKQKKVDEWNFPYTFNPYMGCHYRCIYCYAQKFPFNGHARFGEEIKPKINVPEILCKELGQITKPPFEIQIGNSWEVYQPIEKKYGITRRCLEVFRDFPKWKIHLETRTDLILRDIDILRDLDVEVEMTIAVLDNYRLFEPYCPSPKLRLEVIKELSDNGIFVRVMIMPIIPGYTDVEKIKKLAYKNGAKAHKEKELKHFTVEQLLK